MSDDGRLGNWELPEDKEDRLDRKRKKQEGLEELGCQQYHERREEEAIERLTSGMGKSFRG